MVDLIKWPGSVNGTFKTSLLNFYSKDLHSIKAHGTLC